MAKGVIANLIEKLKAEGDDRIDIVYLCSNTAICASEPAEAAGVRG